MDKANKNQTTIVTLKLWFGGCFKRGDEGLIYVGSTFRTVGIDPNEMCWFTMVEESEKCGFKREVNGIFFMSSTDGLQRALNDTHAMVICKKALEERVGDCYIVPGCDVPQLMQLVESGVGLTLMKMSSKMVPRRKGSTSIKKGPPLSLPTIETPALFSFYYLFG